jgi:hypothetical protein
MDYASMSWHIVSAFELKVFLFLVGAYIGTFADLGMFECFLCGINLNYLFSKVTHSTVVSPWDKEVFTMVQILVTASGFPPFEYVDPRISSKRICLAT